MNRKDARKIAETISNQELKQMFDSAKISIINWKQVSICNKGMTKGTAWNVLAKDFDINYDHHILAKTNMVREFGDWLPGNIKPTRVPKNPSKPPYHQDPIFNQTINQ